MCLCVCVCVLCRDLAPAVTMLHMFLSSPKPTLRYVAVKSLSAIAVMHPSAVSVCSHLLSLLHCGACECVCVCVVAGGEVQRGFGDVGE